MAPPHLARIRTSRRSGSTVGNVIDHVEPRDVLFLQEEHSMAFPLRKTWRPARLRRSWYNIWRGGLGVWGRGMKQLTLAAVGFERYAKTTRRRFDCNAALCRDRPRPRAGARRNYGVPLPSPARSARSGPAAVRRS